MTGNLKVSVLMPVYNGGPYLCEAVEGILHQTFSDFEFIVVDDGSTDATPEILDGYGDDRLIRLRFEHNQGYVHALNEGLKIARGELIARQDADDISLPERLAAQVELLDRQPEIVLVGSAYYVINESGDHLKQYCPPPSDTAIRWQMLFQNSFVHTSVMFRADVIRKEGLRYDPRLVPSEDYGLWSQLLGYGQGANIETPLVKHRVHVCQVSKIGAERQKANADCVSRANLERLGAQVSDADLRILRDWQFRFPRSLSGQDMKVFRASLTILKEFEKQPGVDPAAVRRIRQEWIRHTLSGVRASQLRDLWGSGLLKSMIGEDAFTVFTAACSQLPKRITRRVERSLQPSGSGGKA